MKWFINVLLIWILLGDFDDTYEDVESHKLSQHLIVADLMNGAIAGDMAREIPQHA